MKTLRKILILCGLICLSACSQHVLTDEVLPLEDGGELESTVTISPTASAVVSLPDITDLVSATPTINAYPVNNAQPTITDAAGLTRNPLTRLPVSDPDILQRHPVMVKLANWPRDERPQAGLSQADLVFETYIGNQMNQFLALYYGEDSEAVGPVRSGRLVDAQLGNYYQGFWFTPMLNWQPMK